MRRKVLDMSCTAAILMLLTAPHVSAQDRGAAGARPAAPAADAEAGERLRNILKDKKVIEKGFAGSNRPNEPAAAASEGRPLNPFGSEPSTNPNEPKPAPGPPIAVAPGPLPKPAPGLGRNMQP